MTAPTEDYRWLGPAAEAVKVRIRAALLAGVIGLFETLCGSATKSKGVRWRFPGAVEVDVRGSKQGRWRQWSAGPEAKGDPLAAIRWFEFNGREDWPAIWDWAARHTGIAPPDGKPETPAERRERLERQKREREARERARITAEERERAAKITAALAIWNACIAIAGTLGEIYLTMIRGIPLPPGGWPRDVVRFHAADRAVVFAATTADGEVTAVHQIYLTPTGQNRVVLKDKKLRKLKLTRGVLEGAVVRLPSLGHGLRAPLQHAEGCETGLSGWLATGYATQIWLGGLPRAKLPHGRVNILLRDDDAPGSPADRHLEKAISDWRADGITVVCATPWSEPRGDKSDFNDVLREAGLEEARRQIHLAELEAHGLRPAAAPFPLPTAGLAEIRGNVARTVAHFGLHRLDNPPPRMLMTDPTGSGKTQEILTTGIKWVVVDRAAKRPHREYYMVPEHRLSREIEGRVAKATAKDRLSVAVYRSRQPPADEITAMQPLCKNLVEVNLAEAAGADVTSAVCKNGEHQCEFLGWCKRNGYFAQLDRAVNADITLLASNFTFRALPKPLTKNIGTVIIDEDPSEHGYSIIELGISQFSDEALREHPVLIVPSDNPEEVVEDVGEPDPDATDELQRGHIAMQSVIDQIGQGRTAAEATRVEGLTKRQINRFDTLNYRRRVAPEMWPGMPLAQRRAAAAHAAKINPLLPKMHALYSALAEAAPTKYANSDDLNAQLSLDSDPPPNRVTVEGGKITVFWLKPPAKWLATRPVLIASATARPELLRKFFPTLEHTPPPAPAMPNVTLRQVNGGFGKHRMRKRAPALIKRAQYEMHDYDGVTITYKEHEKAFAVALGGAGNVAHWGGFVGSNRFRDVEKLLSFGGPFPPDQEIARKASCEAGRIVPVEAPVPTPYRGLLDTGEGFEGSRMAYRDPAAQAVLEGIYDSAIIQAIGRARPLLRTAANPAQITVCANVPLPFPVASISRLRPVTKLEEVIATGIVPDGGAGLHRFHPAIIPSEQAGRSAIWRIGGRDELRAEVRLAAGRWPVPSLRVIFQPVGQGHGLQAVVVRRDRLAEAEAAARRDFPAGFVSWEVRPFSDGRSPIKAGEDRFAGLQNIKTGGRNALLDPVPDHWAPAPPIAESTSPRGPPDG